VVVVCAGVSWLCEEAQEKKPRPSRALPGVDIGSGSARERGVANIVVAPSSKTTARE